MASNSNSYKYFFLLDRFFRVGSEGAVETLDRDSLAWESSDLSKEDVSEGVEIDEKELPKDFDFNYSGKGEKKYEEDLYDDLEIMLNHQENKKKKENEA